MTRGVLEEGGSREERAKRESRSEAINRVQRSIALLRNECTA